MTVITDLTDLRSEIENYGVNYLTLDVSVSPVEGAGDDVNEGETFEVTVTATNDGDLDMKKVTLFVSGTEFATVGKTLRKPTSTGNDFGLPARDLPRGGTPETWTFYGKAGPDSTGDERPVCTVALQSWEADVSSLLVVRKGESIGPANEKKVNIISDL